MMGESTKIEWTDHTFNPWWGCTRVSPGCEHCYAESFSKRVGLPIWGRRKPRRFMSDAYWTAPLNWNAKAERAGRRRRVFCGSMCDVFERRSDLETPRTRLFRLIEATPALDWLLLSKRPENMLSLSRAAGWRFDWPRNVWAGCTVEDQRRADERILALVQVPAMVRFLSCEPLLERVNLGLLGTLPKDIFPNYTMLWERIHWVIAGGESGHGARPFDLRWARALRDECVAARVAFFCKQLGSNAHDRSGRVRFKDHKGGDWDEWPNGLRVRAWPTSPALDGVDLRGGET
jgi:protein gp37